ncbi:hypothetical protein JHK85_052925 [Glycine max]|nr:hypothetical protein JHK85_052925 [Glycine max]
MERLEKWKMALHQVANLSGYHFKQGDVDKEFCVTYFSLGSDLLLRLPEVKDESSSSLVEPLIGWPISQTDAEIIDINKKFLTQLKAKLKNSNNLDKGEFISSLNSYLENIEGKLGIVIGVDSSRSGYTRILIDKLGVFIGKDVASLVLDENVSLEIWEMVRALIVNSIIEHSCYSNLVTKLVGNLSINYLVTYLT